MRTQQFNNGAQAPNVAGALKLAALGYAVFPKQRNSKFEFSDKPDRAGKRDYNPALTRKQATTDAAKIIAMFSDKRLNVAYVVQAGRVVVDVDKRRGDLDRLPQIGKTFIIQTASGGLQISYILPARYAHLRGEFKHEAGEIKLAGSVMTGAGSYINGVPYTVVDDSPIALAPEWLLEAVERHAAQREVLTARGQIEPAEPVSDKRAARWAEAVLLAECGRVQQEPKGNRFKVLQSASFKIGQVVHYIGEGVAREQLLAVTKDYDNPLKVAKIIETGLAKGALNPRSPKERDYTTATRKTVSEMSRLCDVAGWGGSVEFDAHKRDKRGGKRVGVQKFAVRKTTIRGVLSAILTHAGKANRLELNLSQRFIAERAHACDNTAWKALHGAMEMGLLELLEMSDGLEKPNTYRLTPKGFLALQRASMTAKICIKSESSVRHLKEGQGAPLCALDNSPFSLQLLDSLLIHIAQADKLGIFTSSTLSRSSLVVLRALAYGAKTVAQIADSTGLQGQTIKRSLKRLSSAQMVTREGERSALWAIAKDFLEQAIREAREYGVAERDAKKAKRHDAEREARRNEIARRKKEREEGQAQRPVLVVEPKEVSASAISQARYSEQLEALRNRLEASAYYRQKDMQEVMRR